MKSSFGEPHTMDIKIRNLANLVFHSDRGKTIPPEYHDLVAEFIYDHKREIKKILED